MKNTSEDLFTPELGLFDGRQADTGDAGEDASGAAPEKTAGEGAEETAPDAGERAPEKPESEAALRREFRELVSGRFRDIYTQETQRMIDRRFRETKRLESELSRSRPVMEELAERYGLRPSDAEGIARALRADDGPVREKAEKAGMSVGLYRELQRLRSGYETLLGERRAAEGRRKAERQLESWYGQAEGLRLEYPDFSLEREAKDGRFTAMLRAGLSVGEAYRAAHFDELVDIAAKRAADEAEKRVADSVRATGARVAENGTLPGSSFTVKNDVSRLTRRERAEIARRVLSGERITL